MKQISNEEWITRAIKLTSLFMRAGRYESGRLVMLAALHAAPTLEAFQELRERAMEELRDYPHLLNEVKHEGWRGLSDTNFDWVLLRFATGLINIMRGAKGRVVMVSPKKIFDAAGEDVPVVHLSVGAYILRRITKLGWAKPYERSSWKRRTEFLLMMDSPLAEFKPGDELILMRFIKDVIMEE